MGILDMITTIEIPEGDLNVLNTNQVDQLLIVLYNFIEYERDNIKTGSVYGHIQLKQKQIQVVDTILKSLIFPLQ